MGLNTSLVEYRKLIKLLTLLKDFRLILLLNLTQEIYYKETCILTTLFFLLTMLSRVLQQAVSLPSWLVKNYPIKSMSTPLVLSTTSTKMKTKSSSNRNYTMVHRGSMSTGIILMLAWNGSGIQTMVTLSFITSACLCKILLKWLLLRVFWTLICPHSRKTSFTMPTLLPHVSNPLTRLATRLSMRMIISRISPNQSI